MADKIECVDTIEKFFHLVNDEVEKHGYSVDEVLWIWASGQVAFEGDSKVTMRTLKEEVRRAASTNTTQAEICRCSDGDTWRILHEIIKSKELNFCPNCGGKLSAVR